MSASESPSPEPASAPDDRREKLDLADWRRRLAELYAEVRELAALDPRAAWDHWRRVRERLFREHPSSPLPPERRADFAARHFPYDPAYRFELPVEEESAAESHGAASTAGAAAGLHGGIGIAPLPLPISVGRPLAFVRLGWVDVPLPAGSRRLAIFWLPEYAGGIFLPFRDATNDAETYGGGRYLLDGAKSADLGGDPERRTLVVDFNFAYQPSCAFDPRWSCPLSPPENRLDLPIRVGERLR